MFKGTDLFLNNESIPSNSFQLRPTSKSAAELDRQSIDKSNNQYIINNALLYS